MFALHLVMYIFGAIFYVDPFINFGDEMKLTRTHRTICI
jgi:hypothetical protein